MNNLTIYFSPNFQSSRILNETLYENAKLLSETSNEAKEVQKAMIAFQSEVNGMFWPLGNSSIIIQ